MEARILQVNVSPQGGLPKHPLTGAVRILRSGVEGDHNRYRTEKLHGDPDSALLLVPLSTIKEYAAEGYKVGPGSMGENVTLAGIREEDMAEGQIWQLGATVRIQIRRRCDPCSELAVYGEGLVKRSMGKRGWYAAVLQEGIVKAGDMAHLLPST